MGTETFQKYWHIKKDDCNYCKDCEYRYMCLDNRVPIKQINNLWEFDASCAYNPLISVWSE